MLKVVYLTQTPATERDKKRYGIDFLIADGFDVSVWDLTSWFKGIKHDFFGYRQKIEEELEALPKDTIIICLIGYRPVSLWLYQAIAKAGLRWGLLEMNATPTHPKNDSVKNLLKRMKFATIAKTKHYVFPRIPCSFLGVQPATFEVLGGSMSVHHTYPVDDKTVRLWSHHPDYDMFLEAMADHSVPVVESPYCVFLDEYLPFHPDYSYNNQIPPYNPEEYYVTIRRFFDEVEKIYKIPVVIALHPRASKSFFGKRTVHQGNTALLVKHSDFVITHASNSINFAVLFRKPILFTVTESIKKDSHEYGIVQWITKWLCQEPVNIDNQNNWIIPFVNNGIYDRYEDAYIWHTPESQFVGNVLADYLKGK